MSTRDIKGVLVKPKEDAIPYTLKYTSFRDLYPLLDCETFDIATRKFGDNYYDIYLDDNGLLEEKYPAILTADKNGDIVEYLVGNCFICKHDKNGAIRSLTDSEIKEILSYKSGKLLVCGL